ncbi:MAG: HI1506-related protein [Rhizobiaceae bacterium]
MAKTPKNTETPAGSVRITSRQAGFRRCGMEHPDKPVVHKPGAFSETQIMALEAEPMLIVDRLGEVLAGEVEN